MEAVVLDILPHKKAEAAHEDEDGDGEADDGVARIRGHGGEGFALDAHQVDARVAEGGYRREYRHPDPPAPAEVGNKAEAHHKGAQAFKQKGAQEDGARQLDHARKVGRGDRFLHEGALF